MTTSPGELLGLTDRTVLHWGERATIRMQRRFSTTVDDLWSACTDPQRLARWLGVVTGEPAVGSNVDVEIRGAPLPASTVRVGNDGCAAPRRLTVTWEADGERPTAIDVSLAATRDGTVLTLEHTALHGDEAAVQQGRWWERHLLVLDGLLAEVAAPPRAV
jgi:uncharacterized protein YndB with AHSA1/START domain